MFVFVCAFVFVCLRVREVARQRLAKIGGGELPLATRKWRKGGVERDVAGCRELIENGRNEGIGEAAGSCKKLGICVRVCDCVRVYVCVYAGVCVFDFVFVVFSCLEASTMLQSLEF